MTAYLQSSSGGPDGLSEYCARLFSQFTRSDQRRWGEVYIRGLLDADGRKTPARISEHVLGHKAPQQLQQFVSQSPWDYSFVRRHLAEWVASAMPPAVWSVDEVMFPKNGTHSAGVGRQFVSSEGRTVNCQLALAASLVSEAGSVPVNWRLLMPPHWDADPALRSAARIPETEQYRPRWQHVLAAVDEMARDWALAPAPVLVSWKYEAQVGRLLGGLEARGLPYLVEIGPGTPVTGRSPRPRGRVASAVSGQEVPCTAAELALAARHHSGRATLAWREGVESYVRSSQFMAAQVPHAGDAMTSEGHVRRLVRPRQLLMEWPEGTTEPSSYWLTNLGSRRMPELVSAAKLRWRSRYDLARLREECGLLDFEGRSFRGWHHHVTLASAAHGFRVLGRVGDSRTAASERRTLVASSS
ncbi:IS701 family transposase [Actinacidiphila bryophytorum]|jgi:SRSO17 transposase|uniref:IS701 family transposase n=1 Tax=Actinacidiphila bryophytorum TaxID=1436133 RepID=UPI002176D1F2|nr:IS701 family transposase [Actinacidiphila bryophytorum]UWE09222.1 IS701 family transposase [Actinacidiphila bryophytorum]